MSRVLNALLAAAALAATGGAGLVLAGGWWALAGAAALLLAALLALAYTGLRRDPGARQTVAGRLAAAGYQVDDTGEPPAGPAAPVDEGLSQGLTLSGNRAARRAAARGRKGAV